MSWIGYAHGPTDFPLCFNASDLIALHFREVRRQHWLFASNERTLGMNQPVWLEAAAGVAIVRHVKIWSAANPFDPAWTHYLDRRRAHRQVVRPSGCREA